MGRHIISTFVVVCVAAGFFRSELLKEVFQVRAHLGSGIFLNEERR